MEATHGVRLTTAERWLVAARRAGTHSLVGLPPIILAFLAFVSIRKGSVSLDLAHAYIPAAHKVLHGRSPYPPATLAALAPHDAFVYPPVTAWLVVPFTVLPIHVAEAVGFALGIGAVAGLLWLLGVRDWRCYMIAYLWVPTYSAIQTANVSLALAVGIAALWRYRSRPVVSGILMGLLIAIKLYVWPLGIWLLATRRYRVATSAAMTGALLVVVSWIPISFAGLRGYPHLLNLLTQVERADGYTISALLAPGIVSWGVANVVAYAGGLAVLIYAWRSARGGDERLGFVYAIAAMLMLTPIVSMNYFVVLLVVIALYAPTFSWIWALPLALWVAPQVSNGQPWQLAAALVCVGATIVAASRLAQAPATR
jgi:hypothetical protein